MVSGLVAAAEMADQVAAIERLALRHARERGDTPAALRHEHAARALSGLASAIRVRAGEETTGAFLQIADPGPGWMRDEATPVDVRPRGLIARLLSRLT